MLSRDFVKAFLVGQVESGIPEDLAKVNFTNWLMSQDESLITNPEKEAVLSDLSSYTVR